MIAKFDSFSRYETPSIMLCGADSVYKDGIVTSVIGYLTDISDEELILNFSTTSELNFRAYQIYRDDDDANKVMLDLYSKLKNRRLLFVEDVGYFAITNIDEQFSDGMSYKDVTATSCEVEFENRKVPFIGKVIESTDEDGKTQVDYTYAFRDLLDLLVGSVPKWTYDVNDIDTAVINKSRTFEDVDDDENILAFMQSEVQQAYECIFIFDIINRMVSVKDQNSFATETSIHLTKDDLITELDITENSDDLYTALTVFGDSDDITINGVNPLGTNAIYNFDYYLTWMSPALQAKLAEWKEEVAAGEEYMAANYSGYAEKKQSYLNEQLEIERLEQLISLYSKAEANIRVAMTSVPTTADTIEINTEGMTAEEIEAARKAAVAEEQTKKAKEIISDYNKEIARIFGESRSEYNISESILNIENGSIEVPKTKAESDLAAAKAALSSSESEVSSYDSSFNALAQSLQLQNYLSSDLYIELSNYVYEGSYSDPYITVTDTMTQTEIYDQEFTLYNRAKAQLRKISAPTQKFDVDTESFIFVKDFLPWSEQLNTGACVNVELEENDIASLFLTTITVNFYDKKLKLTFGNRLKRNDPKALYEDILGNVRKTANSLSFLNEVVSPVKVGLLDDFAQELQNSRNLTMRNALAADNQSFTMDNYGITGTALDDENELSPYQIKITNESIVFTTDNWKTCSTALGRFFYTDPTDGKDKSVYGVNAEVVAGAKIMGAYILGGDIEGTAIHGGTIWGTDIYATDMDPRELSDSEKSKLAYMRYNTKTKRGEVYGFTVSGGTIWGAEIYATDSDPTGLTTAEKNKLAYMRYNSTDKTGEIHGFRITGGSLNINDKFIVDSYGNLTLDGNITWGTDNSPICVLYARSSLSTPTGSYSSYPSSSSYGWHTSLNVYYDYYASYSYNGGNTWTSAIKIQGTDGTNGTNGRDGTDGKDGENGTDATVTRIAIANALLAKMNALNLGDGIYSDTVNGQTCISINATAIKAGVINADLITVAGSTVTLNGDKIEFASGSRFVKIDDTGIQMQVVGDYSWTYNGRIVGLTGNAGGVPTDGIAMVYSLYDTTNYVIVTSAGARLNSSNAQAYAAGNVAQLKSGSCSVTAQTSGTNTGCFMTVESNKIYVQSGGCYSTSAINVGSDKRIKDNIDYNYDKYSDFFMALKPALYTYKAMPNGGVHTGFIAQDVEDALESTGLSSANFAGLSVPPCQDDDFSFENCSAENSYMLAYSEFTSLNTYMIQRLYNRVEALEKELAELRGV